MSENTISSVQDALYLLQIVAAHPDCGLSELARLSGLNKSRTYRMLCTLSQCHFVCQHPQTGTYSLSHAALVLGQAARAQVDLAKAADAVSDSLMAQFNENLQLRIIEGLETVQIWRRVSSQSLQVRSSIGNRRALGSGAAGRLLLAFAPQNIQATFIRTQHWSAEQQAQLDTIRRQGFAISQGELTSGVCAFAVPVFNAKGECAACFSLSSPQSRTDETRSQAILAALRQAADNMSQQLGFKMNDVLQPLTTSVIE